MLLRGRLMIDPPERKPPAFDCFVGWSVLSQWCMNVSLVSSKNLGASWIPNSRTVLLVSKDAMEKMRSSSPPQSSLGSHKRVDGSLWGEPLLERAESPPSLRVLLPTLSPEMAPVGFWPRHCHIAGEWSRWRYQKGLIWHLRSEARTF